MTDFFKNDFQETKQLLEYFINEEKNFKVLEKAGMIIVEAINSGNKLISCGNGGSMTDAMHFAEEFTGRFREDRKALPAIAISDPAHITCVANDFGFEHIFSRYIEALGKKNDVLFAISTSGNSPNILLAAKAARILGMKIIALTGKGGGKLSDNCDVEIRVPFDGYSDRIQEIHILIIHSLLNYVENSMKN